QSAGVRDGLETAVLRQPPAKGVRGEIRAKPRQKRGRLPERGYRLSRPHLSAPALAEQPAAFPDLSAIQLSYQPFRHLGNARIDCTRGSDVFEGHWCDRLQASLYLDVRSCGILACQERGCGCVAGRHAQRIEYSFLDDIFPALAGYRGDDLSGDHIQHVVIGVPATEASCRFNISEPSYDFFA